MNDFKNDKLTAHFHLPGLFEFCEFYQVFLPLFYEQRELFYDWVDISSIYGAPCDCLWGGGRFGAGECVAEEILDSLGQYGISARLTFSNSLLNEAHLKDYRCNRLCDTFEKHPGPQNGVIVHSDLLLNYLRNKYPGLYFVSSTTKVLTDRQLLINELERDEFKFVVPDFRHNNRYSELESLNDVAKSKMEFLVNECCWIGCKERYNCYENISRKMLEDDCPEHICTAPDSQAGYRFSRTMRSQAFIGNKEISNWYLPHGFTNFKIEGRNLGTAVVLEFLLYYLTKPECQLEVREKMYLDSMLDLF